MHGNYKPGERELSSFQKRFCTILTSLVLVHHFGYCDAFDVQVCSVVLVNHVQEDGIHFDFALQIDLCTIQKGSEIDKEVEELLLTACADGHS